MNQAEEIIFDFYDNWANLFSRKVQNQKSFPSREFAN
jgi:hypothetical protein